MNLSVRLEKIRRCIQVLILNNTARAVEELEVELRTVVREEPAQDVVFEDPRLAECNCDGLCGLRLECDDLHLLREAVYYQEH